MSEDTTVERAIDRIGGAVYGLSREQRQGLGASEARNIITNLRPAIERELAAQLALSRGNWQTVCELRTTIAERDAEIARLRRLATKAGHYIATAARIIEEDSLSADDDDTADALEFAADLIAAGTPP